MIIGVSDGDMTRFEVLLMTDGYIVRARSLETGEVFSIGDRLFRTAPAAFAFAQKSALKDAEDGLPSTSLDAFEARLETDRAARVFDDIRSALGDGGVSAHLLRAWDANRAAAPALN
jgi:hypothetical protein